MSTATLPRPVQVLHEGAWVDGWLEAVRRDADCWRGYVRYAVGPGLRYLQWRSQDELRRGHASGRAAEERALSSCRHRT